MYGHVVGVLLLAEKETWFGLVGTALIACGAVGANLFKPKPAASSAEHSPVHSEHEMKPACGAHVVITQIMQTLSSNVALQTPCWLGAWGLDAALEKPFWSHDEVGPAAMHIHLLLVAAMLPSMHCLGMLHFLNRSTGGCLDASASLRGKPSASGCRFHG